MVLPDKLLRVGLALGMHLPVNGHVLAQRDVALAGATNTDLVRFHSTLKVARGIVEEQKRAEMVEVSTDGLVSILNRIKALEDEVMALMNGKQPSLSAGGEMSDAGAVSPAGGSPAGTGLAAGGSPAGTGLAAGGSPAGTDLAAGGSPIGTGFAAGGSPAGTGLAAGGEPTLGAATPIAAGSDAGGAAAGGILAQSTGSPMSPMASGGGGSSDESSAAKPSNGAVFKEDKGEEEDDECAPEKLLYSLGGGSLQKRDNSVSGHPLFRRNANCTLENVTGAKKVDSGRPDVTPIASAAAESQETTGADTEDEDKNAAPAAATSTPKAPKAMGGAAGEDDSDDEPLPTAVGVDGKTLPVETVEPSQLADEADNPPPAVVTAGDDGSLDKSPPSLSAGGMFKEEEYTTVVVTSTLDHTMTMTLTKTKTRTIHLKSSPTADAANEKYAEYSQPSSAPAEASSPSIKSAPSTDASEGETENAEDSETSGDAMEMEPTSAPAEEASATPDAESTENVSKKPMTVGQEKLFKNGTKNETIKDPVKQFPPVAEQISIPPALLEDPTPFANRPTVTPPPAAMSKSTHHMMQGFMNGTALKSRPSGFKTMLTTRRELPVAEAQ